MAALVLSGCVTDVTQFCRVSAIVVRWLSIGDSLTLKVSICFSSSHLPARADAGDAAVGQKSLKPRGAVKFGDGTAADASVIEDVASEEAATEADDDEAANEEGGKSRKVCCKME